VIIVFISLYFIVTEAMEQAQALLDKFDLSGGAVDMEAITNAATQASLVTESNTELYVNLIIISWIVSIVDAFITGRKLDMIESSSDKT